MNWKFVAGLAFGIFLSACQPPATNTNTSPANNANTANQTNANAARSNATLPASTNLQELAQRIVTQSAGVKEGEVVLISGSTRDMELLENVVTEVQKVGGDPLLTVDSERVAKNYYAQMPEKQDSKEQKVGMNLAKFANVTISVDSAGTGGLLADVPPLRLAARAKA